MSRMLRSKQTEYSTHATSSKKTSNKNDDSTMINQPVSNKGAATRVSHPTGLEFSYSVENCGIRMNSARDDDSDTLDSSETARAVGSCIAVANASKAQPLKAENVTSTISSCSTSENSSNIRSSCCETSGSTTSSSSSSGRTSNTSTTNSKRINGGDTNTNCWYLRREILLNGAGKRNTSYVPLDHVVRRKPPAGETSARTTPAPATAGRSGLPPSSSPRPPRPPVTLSSLAPLAPPVLRPFPPLQLLLLLVVPPALVLVLMAAGATDAQRNTFHEHFRKCPQQCACTLDVNQGKKLSCESGGLNDVPIMYMDPGIQVFHLTAPPDLPNEISLGRFFGMFSQLEEIRITHSRIPAIGEHTFYSLRRLQILDLSHNNITTLIDKDFYGLVQLKVLNLTGNQIFKCPSAPFRHLRSLTSLILADNRLQLAPRLFYMLKNLQRLDLSGNPLNSIDPDILKDLRPVTRLYLARCNLSSLHSLVYQQLPNLEHLDLRDNRFTYLAPEEFRHLSRLQVLHLDGNKLTTLKDRTFDGQTLRHLGLSRNSISTVESCAFCNSSISELNLARNRLIEPSAREDPLRALSLSLEKLDLSHNLSLRGATVADLIRSLHRLVVLNLEGIGLYDLPATTFSPVPGLRQLYLNHNKFSEFRYSLFLELRRLEVLNISHNNLKFLRSSVIRSLNDTNTRIVMHDNPWKCQTCYMNHLLTFLSQRPIDDTVKPPLCADPAKVRGRDLYHLKIFELEDCNNPVLEPRISGTESQVGLVVAIIIIMVIVTIIIATIVIYKTQGAVYYTHEEERSRGGSLSYDNYGCSKDGFDSKRPSLVATIDDTISRSS